MTTALLAGFGKTALITGASDGMVRAIARGFDIVPPARSAPVLLPAREC